jgi:hypothetical protein
MSIKERMIQKLNEAAGKANLSGTKVGKVLADNVKKTSAKGGPVQVSIMRGNTVIAFVKSGDKISDSFNAKLGAKGWSVGNSPMTGAPSAITKDKRSFDDDTAAKALQALFDKVS